LSANAIKETRLAAVAAFLIIAAQVAGKAIRDATFLQTFPVEALPTMLAGSAVVSLAAVVRASRVLAAQGPRDVVPRAFLISGCLLFIEAAVFYFFADWGAVLLFLHLAAIGGVLISWFWSLMNERFDARQARSRIATVAAGGTLGGYVGGLSAAAAGTTLSETGLIAALGVAHLLAFPPLWLLSRGSAATTRLLKPPAPLAGAQTVWRDDYLRAIAIIVVLTTIAAGCIDFVFKSRAVEQWREANQLVRFFALYYTGLSLLTFMAQAALSRRLLGRAGVIGTLASLPIVLSLLVPVALLFPSLLAALVLKGVEGVTTNSLYRSAYELLFVPVAKVRKRIAKLWLDVGADRVGDALAGGLVTLLITTLPREQVEPVALSIAFLVALVIGWRMARLHRRYVGTLGGALQRRADALEFSPRDEIALQTMLMSQSQLPNLPAKQVIDVSSESVPQAPAAALLFEAPPGHEARVAALRSGDANSTVAQLHRLPADATALAPLVIALLAWDAVHVDVLKVLRAFEQDAIGPMLTALADPDEDFAVRRRLPRALSAHPRRDVIAALFERLSDQRFEVRYQCGQALWRMVQRGRVKTVPHDRVLQVVENELRVERAAWANHRLLDESPQAVASFIGDVLQRRVDRSLEHVFTLLALIYDADALRIAYRSLSETDEKLRGTALEYLEVVLPPKIGRRIVDFLEATPGESTHAPRPVEEVLRELIEQNRSLEFEVSGLQDANDISDEDPS
jgi:AAA family ATP:ADP antiporter